MNIRLGAFSHSVCQSSLYASRGEKDSNDQHKSWHSCVYCSIRLASIIDLESLAEWSKTLWIFIHLILSPSLGEIVARVTLTIAPLRSTFSQEGYNWICSGAPYPIFPLLQFPPNNMTKCHDVPLFYCSSILTKQKCMRQEYHFSKSSWGCINWCQQGSICGVNAHYLC